jgi:hypothetical protein
MGVACRRHGEMRNTKFWIENLQEEDLVGDVRVG